ncbi:sensor histidine kinase [Actinopolymorpha pittospori]
MNDRPSVLGRVPHTRPVVIDRFLALAYVLTALVVTAARVAQGAPMGGLPDWVAAPIVAALGVPLAVRRRWPRAVLGLVLAWGTVVALYLGVLAEPIAAATFALYTVALTAPRIRWMPTRGIGIAGVSVILGMAMLGPAPGWTTATTVVLGAGILAATWTLGRVVRERRLEAARTAERFARQAVIDERLRIARELHDVVAHSMSLIAVKSGVLRHVLQVQTESGRLVGDPHAGATPTSEALVGELADALAVIESTSRGALAEMRHLLGVLRNDGADLGGTTDGTIGGGTDSSTGVDAAPLRPAPGLAQLPDLTRRAAGAGVHVELDVSTSDPLPDGVELSVYRIVQEAVTNVVRHAAPARCRVHVEARAGVVAIQVSDDGPGVRTLPDPNAGVGERDGDLGPRGRHGLVGMRERVAMYGGTFDAGPRPAGGFEVSARIPYEPADQNARTLA